MLHAEMGRLLRCKPIRIVLALLTLFALASDVVTDALHDLNFFQARAHSGNGLLCEGDAATCGEEIPDQHEQAGLFQHASAQPGQSTPSAHSAHNPHKHSQCATCACPLHNGAALDTVAHVDVGITGNALWQFPPMPIHVPDAPPAPIEYPPQLA